MALTEKKIKAAKCAEKRIILSDGGGLYLYVYKTGLKAWKYRFKSEKVDTTLAIGEYPSVSLREARDKRDELEAMIASGQDSRSSNEPEAAVTFREVAEERKKYFYFFL